DPRFQLVHEDDVVAALLFAIDREVPGIYNVAGDGQIPWSEVMAIAGKRGIPMPPFGIALATDPLQRLGLVDFAPEVIELLKYGRGIDNRAFQDAGFAYEHTSAGAVEAFVQAMRLRDTVGSDEINYRYEEDVEKFFRHSPAVQRDRRTT
ncbi:MAG TPA: hypothetical protein VNQ33_09715, partial [Acidimicrobiales bacterium]|nr:hypothetical protein [Acidimicrobiales bacterium]